MFVSMKVSWPGPLRIRPCDLLYPPHYGCPACCSPLSSPCGFAFCRAWFIVALLPPAIPLSLELPVRFVLPASCLAPAISCCYLWVGNSWKFGKGEEPGEGPQRGKCLMKPPFSPGRSVVIPEDPKAPLGGGPPCCCLLGLTVPAAESDSAGSRSGGIQGWPWGRILWGTPPPVAMAPAWPPLPAPSQPSAGSFCGPFFPSGGRPAEHELPQGVGGLEELPCEEWLGGGPPVEGHGGPRREGA